MTTSLGRPTATPVANQSRTLAVLSAAQIIGGVGAGASVSVGALLAEELSGSAAWSGMAATLTTLGAALAALPLARLADRGGRRIALGTGWLLAATGAGLAVLAAVTSSFPLLLLGLTLMGAGNAATLQSRFAATDLATTTDRGRALSLVVWAGTVGAVAGPNLTRPGAAVANFVGVPPLAGPFLFSAAGAILSAAILGIALRPDPLLSARAVLAAAMQTQAADQLTNSAPRPIVTILRSPPARTALLAVVTSHAVMIAVMAMTPIHMHGHGASLTIIGLTISLHIAGMFAFAPLAGWVTDRYGRPAALLTGFTLLITATLTTATAGMSTTRVTIGLIALGLGWSFSTIAGSTLLSESVPARERPAVQGTADLLMNLAGATAGAASGVVVALLDYTSLSLIAAAVVIPAALVAIALMGGTDRRDR